MPEAAARRMTADEFLAWHLGPEERYELIDGLPVAKTRAKRRHDQLVVNAITELGSQLRGGRCRPFSADTAVRIPAGNIRYADAGVDCGVFRDETTWADAPVLVLEVLSEANRAFDFVAKLEDYKTVPSLRHILLADTDTAGVIHWFRGGDDVWSSRSTAGLEASLEIPELNLSLRLEDLYAGLTFRPRSRLVFDEEQPS